MPTPQSQIESLQRALAAAKADIQAVIARVKVVTGVAYSSASAAAMRLEEDRDCARARTLEIRFLLFSQVKTLTEIKRRLYAEVGLTPSARTRIQTTSTAKGDVNPFAEL